MLKVIRDLKSIRERGRNMDFRTDIAWKCGMVNLGLLWCTRWVLRREKMLKGYNYWDVRSKRCRFVKFKFSDPFFVDS